MAPQRGELVALAASQGDEQMHVQNEMNMAETTTRQPPRTCRRNMAVTTGGLLIAACALLFGQSGNAQSERFETPDLLSSQGTCSSRTLRGSYAFNIEGTILAGPNRLLLRGLAMTRFDGRGNLSQVDFTTINGVPSAADWRSAFGTYQLDSNCTGTMEIVQSDGSPLLRLRIVVADHGRTIHNIVEGNATGATGTKVG
jgi:hypothetical protein